MRIYSMTATFGKLEHETLTLTPGLNIIEAPNEWGKSTWCAFLVNMLYGIDSRARTAGNVLPDKERYAPWSGAPMSGRIDLNWNGRDITIERRSTSRLYFTDFRAYETETGLDIPELNGANCGQMLLGVERSVFVRAGFLKLTDLPVTQDEALRRRLNNLVTTGDESGAGDRLAELLKDLKNKCRHNKTGLLPQAEKDREQLLAQLHDLQDLQREIADIHLRQQELEAWIDALENHSAALKYAASVENAARTEAAITRREQAEAVLAEKEAACALLPTKDEAEQTAARAQDLQDTWLELRTEAASLPQKPAEPAVLPHYAGIDDVAAAAREDFAKFTALTAKAKKQSGASITLLILAVLLLGGALVARFGFSVTKFLVPTIGIAAAILLLILSVISLKTDKMRAEMNALKQRHPGIVPEAWVSNAQKYADTLAAYQEALAKWQADNGALESRLAAAQAEIAALTGGKELKDTILICREAVEAWNALEAARRDAQAAETVLQALRASAQPAAKPAKPDELTQSAEETQQLLNEARFSQRQLQLQLGQCMGRAETLGQESLLKARLDTLNRRIARLEDTYYALELAQDALRDATTTLQRRFAPRIAKRSQELFGKLTGGRYQRLILRDDLSLEASAEGEDTVHSSQFRSDGTVDQLYLALRLSVAEELTPDAPLVLDDALVRFDDTRLAQALNILRETAETKQVILFTCQGREKKL
ncbi:MAG: AAA family ATPase [Oscillospiraceae bacterium]|nr:AAA family ATPase [Oscillospiraceae bacterium]